MKVLITGANGFVGAHLARRLCERGDDVRCLVRASSDTSPLSKLAVQLVHGDVSDPASLQPAVTGIDVVFHLAGVRRAPSREDFMRVNAEGTRHLCDAMVAIGARRLVLASSLAAAGPSSPERPKTEADPLTPTEWYGESKAEAERIAFSYSDRVEVTALRPVRILGEGDHENLPFFRIVRRGLKLNLLGPSRPISFVDVDDVVDHLIVVAQKQEAVGQAFFSTHSALTFAQMQELLAEIYGVRTRTIPVPPAVLRAAAAVADGFSTVTGKHLALNRKLARQLLAPAWTCTADKSEALLGFRPRRDVHDAIRRTALWYLGRGWV